MVPAVTHNETKERYREVTPGGRDVPANISHPVGRLREASNSAWAEKLEGSARTAERMRTPGAPSAARSSLTDYILPLGLGSALLDWAWPFRAPLGSLGLTLPFGTRVRPSGLALLFEGRRGSLKVGVALWE